jgi:F-actin capping protein alpha subunit
VKEHFPKAAYGVYPIENDSKIAVVIVASKYSPNNFWYAILALPYKGLWVRLTGSQERPMALTVHLRPLFGHLAGLPQG